MSRCFRCKGEMDEFSKNSRKVKYALCLECAVEEELNRPIDDIIAKEEHQDFVDDDYSGK